MIELRWSRQVCKMFPLCKVSHHKSCQLKHENITQVSAHKMCWVWIPHASKAKRMKYNPVLGECFFFVWALNLRREKSPSSLQQAISGRVWGTRKRVTKCRDAPIRYLYQVSAPIWNKMVDRVSVTMAPILRGIKLPQEPFESLQSSRLSKLSRGNYTVTR